MADELRMDAYYYGFSTTGDRHIDRILSAVACAGKAYHHTEDWTDDTDPYPGHTGDCPTEWIQNAAVDASARIKRLESLLRRCGLCLMDDPDMREEISEALRHD